MFSEDLYANLSAQLSSTLALDQPPVSIRFAESIPDGMQGPAAQVPAGCRFWEDATTASFATSAADHQLCAIGVHTHNLEPSPAQQTDLMDALKVFGELGYVTAADLPLIPVLGSRPKHVVYSPLASVGVAPDVVLLFVDARQTLILSEATQQVESQNAPAMGRPACAVVPQVMNSGRAALSLGCCGARAYLDILPGSRALFAIPGAKLEAYVARIVALSNANSMLSRFHTLRRQTIESGASPSIEESLMAFESTAG